MREIASFLGEPKPLEIERKFLIKYPDIGALSCDPFCKKVEIEQTYIRYGSGGARIRRRGADGDYIYVLTQKRDISDTVREEREERITKEEYERLLQFADPERKTIKKDRYCLVYKKKYFEIDVYPFWSDRAIMEIELSDDTEQFEIPEMIEVIREVTGEAEYKNYALAGAIPMAEEK